MTLLRRKREAINMHPAVGYKAMVYDADFRSRIDCEACGYHRFWVAAKDEREVRLICLGYKNFGKKCRAEMTRHPQAIRLKVIR